MNQECLIAMQAVYAKFTGYEIAEAVKLIRAELTAEEQRHELQREILAKHAELEKLKMVK